MKKRIVKIIALVFTLLFAWAVYLQHNDPEPFSWYFFYGTAAVSCFLYFLGRFPYILGLLLGLVYFAGALWIWPEKFEGVTIGAGDIENIERGRESLGLVIAAVVMFFLAWQSRPQRTQSSKSN